MSPTAVGRPDAVVRQPTAQAAALRFDADPIEVDCAAEYAQCHGAGVRARGRGEQPQRTGTPAADFEYFALRAVTQFHVRFTGALAQLEDGLAGGEVCGDARACARLADAAVPRSCERNVTPAPGVAQQATGSVV